MVSDSWQVLSKNARVNSEERIVALLAELSSTSWSIVCFSESRCRRQDKLLSEGHYLICEYDDVAASGVAILIHYKFTRFIQRKHLVHDRVMAIDMKLGSRRVRIISVYVPHAGYDFQ